MSRDLQVKEQFLELPSGRCAGQEPQKSAIFHTEFPRYQKSTDVSAASPSGDFPMIDMSGKFEVGYRKPPKQHQFQKGRSGNPNREQRAGPHPPS